MNGSVYEFLINHILGRVLKSGTYCKGDLNYINGIYNERDADRLRNLFAFSKYSKENQCGKCKVYEYENAQIQNTDELRQLFEMHAKAGEFFYPTTVSEEIRKRKVEFLLDASEHPKLEDIAKARAKIEKLLGKQTNSYFITIINAKNEDYKGTGYSFVETNDIAEKIVLAVNFSVFLTTPHSVFGKLIILLRKSTDLTFLTGEPKSNLHSLIHNVDEKVDEFTKRRPKRIPKYSKPTR